MPEHTSGRTAFSIAFSLLGASITFNAQTWQKWEVHEMLTSPEEQQANERMDVVVALTT